MRLTFALLVFLLSLLVPSAALAVTNGSPDLGAHANVGALVADIPGSGLTVLCSGTLIAPTVFLTAGHCTAGLTAPVYVTFDETLDLGTGNLIPGLVETAPGFGHDRADPEDLGVVLLARAPRGILPAPLAAAGSVGALKGAQVTNVGYGYNERTTGAGQPRFGYDGQRRVSSSTVTSITSALVRTGAGVCFGDSGGPRFVGSTLVAVTSSGDSACAGMSTGYRVDTTLARGFLGRFVALP
jgi:trypsin